MRTVPDEVHGLRSGGEMNVEGCWSTVICNASERAAVGYTGTEWTLQCRLSSGHDGNHATDGDRGAAPVRRRWLEWTDFSEYPHSLLEREPCPVPGRAGGACQLYAGHGGLHLYAPGAPASRPPASRPPASPQPASPPPVPSTPVPVAAAALNGAEYRGGHRSVESPLPSAPVLNGVEHRHAEPSTTTPRAGTGAEMSADEADEISDALHGVAQAIERLAKAYRGLGR